MRNFTPSEVAELAKVGGYTVAKNHARVAWVLLVASVREAVGAVAMAVYAASMPHATAAQKNTYEPSSNEDMN